MYFVGNHPVVGGKSVPRVYVVGCRVLVVKVLLLEICFLTNAVLTAVRGRREGARGGAAAEVGE